MTVIQYYRELFYIHPPNIICRRCLKRAIFRLKSSLSPSLSYFYPLWVAGVCGGGGEGRRGEGVLALVLQGISKLNLFHEILNLEGGSCPPQAK